MSSPRVLLTGGAGFSADAIKVFENINGTLLVFTEQGAFLDGYDDAGSRERGTRDLLEALGASLDR